LRILFVTPYVPSTLRIRPWALIRELARQGHQVTLACLAQPAWEQRYLEQVRPFCQDIQCIQISKIEGAIRAMASLPLAEPSSVAYTNAAAFRRLVAGLAGRGSFDIVHTEFVRATPATATLEGLNKVIDAVDAVSLAYRRSIRAQYTPVQQRLVAILEWPKMKRYEKHILKGYQRVLASSPVDCQVLKGYGLTAQVLPNGLDLGYFNYSDQPRSEGTIVFLGKMCYYVNVASILWFYHQVFPLIRQKKPSVRLKIVGREPTAEIRALARDPAVEVTGTVTDVRPYLSEAKVSICPMVSGSGIQNKLLEAMGVGTPCVATSLASQALGVSDGRELLVADEAADFAEAVLQVLADGKLWRMLSQNGRQYVEKNHDWIRVGQQLEQVYLDLLASPIRSY
jgi:sugar transferase (PEP-CTERM/EpsH1 system associated)